MAETNGETQRIFAPALSSQTVLTILAALEPQMLSCSLIDAVLTDVRARNVPIDAIPLRFLRAYEEAGEWVGSAEQEEEAE